MDVAPPTWRRSAGTTFARFELSRPPYDWPDLMHDNNGSTYPFYPEEEHNPYKSLPEDVSATVFGVTGRPHTTSWEAHFEGKDGVWRLVDDPRFERGAAMDLMIANQQMPTGQTEIVVQITYLGFQPAVTLTYAPASSGPPDPRTAEPASTELVPPEEEDVLWRTAILRYELPLCPAFEVVNVRPLRADSEPDPNPVWIDEVIIDTRCRQPEDGDDGDKGGGGKGGKDDKAKRV